MRYFYHSLRIMGTVEEINPDDLMFKVRCESGDVFDVYVGSATSYEFIKNLDQLNQDRTKRPEGYDDSIQARLKRYVQKDKLVSAYGIHLIHENQQRFDAREIMLFHDESNHYLFEGTHWWLTQISTLADGWLDDLFGIGNNFDFSHYQTNLSFIGTKTENPIQECATLSRLIYGLSSAYLMTGNDRYYQAARAGVEYQRDTFRTDSHDGSFIVWAFGCRNGKKIMPSQSSDDMNAIPLYEQIYALAGLTQFYRITNDWETLDDIRRTIEFFNQRFWDKDLGGFFSHVDYATLTPDTEFLGENRNKKNWNSIGDHTPAYLLNLMLSIENMAEIDFNNLFNNCKEMQEKLADLIIKKFPDPNQEIPYVNERFFGDWKPDHHYRWQQNRAVVGHNLKIAWNLTRIYHLTGKQDYLDLAIKLAESMRVYGIDQIRGGCFDVVERKPSNNMPIEFTWHDRKAWWQQEQTILAFLVLYGTTQDEDYLRLARQSIAFWNLAYLNFDHEGVYFDVTDDAVPYVKGDRSLKGSHSKSGYHVFELNFLAQLYIRSFVDKESFRLYFKPCPGRKNNVLNVMPDYLPHGCMKIGKVCVNGNEHTKVNTETFQVDLSDYREDEIEVAVEFIPVK